MKPLLGAILEQNRIWNCDTGVFIYEGDAASLPVTKDIVVRDNHFYKVLKGVSLKMTSDPNSPAIGRLSILNNVIELDTSGTPIAINISSTAAPKTQSNVEQLVARQNQIRHTDGDAGPVGTLGINLECIDEAIVEENLINIGAVPTVPDNTKAIVRTSTVKKMKTFNNQSSAGLFVASWNSSLSMHDGDPITDMEDSLIGLL